MTSLKSSVDKPRRLILSYRVFFGAPSLSLATAARPLPRINASSIRCRSNMASCWSSDRVKVSASSGQRALQREPQNESVRSVAELSNTTACRPPLRVRQIASDAVSNRRRAVLLRGPSARRLVPMIGFSPGEGKRPGQVQPRPTQGTCEDLNHRQLARTCGVRAPKIVFLKGVRVEERAK